MKAFIHEDFILENKYAKQLFHNFAKDMPIIDYHNHLSTKDIAEDRQYQNITQAWLEGDHYKWRAMRANGVSEEYITGNKSEKEKFLKWAATVPHTLRNPLFHWTHLELKTYFNLDTLLSSSSANEVYDQTSNLLQLPENSCRNLLAQKNVKLVGTTDDPLDTLEDHQKNNNENKVTMVCPTWRPDNILGIEKGKDFLNYVNRLEEVAGKEITSYEILLEVLKDRMAHFNAVGCKMSDHSLSEVPTGEAEIEEVEGIFKKSLKGITLTKEDQNAYKKHLLIEMGKEYHRLGWVMQLHVGALRNNSERQFKKLGPDTGFDSISDSNHVIPLSKILSDMDLKGQLPKTIIYNLNPADNYPMGTLVGNFQDGITPGKIQLGSGWWFLDQKEAMEWQINTLSNIGLLSKFVGMLTDSRSFLSFPRHEYFRRTLCNLLGNDIEKGLVPNDINWVGSLVQDICYNNIKQYAFSDLKL
ncbi:glucuronate isomerase [Flammeovirga sp. EKP202]|uniref:glucuronate isomerase n=1 Tax=Flammeovirga sp. EKP202 TaxID=2770592 RepID=UPI00165F60D6|nr:glucuronate isomerase [Flammeovirga sp. EKP202]MBD0403476.1 glucuronate isomerase [Flammeovirga sp. EKP202]